MNTSDIRSSRSRAKAGVIRRRVRCHVSPSVTSKPSPAIMPDRVRERVGLPVVLRVATENVFDPFGCVTM
jgi:hypothetical protein